jgi:fructosamine-3-kinase
VWMVKETFGFDGDKDIGQMTYPRTWSNRYSRFVLESVNGIPS